MELLFLTITIVELCLAGDTECYTSTGYYTTPQQEAHFLIIPKMTREFEKDNEKSIKREEIHKYIISY